MTALPDLTLVLGPQTTASLALNAVVREARGELKSAGLTALPSRLASPLLRRVVDDRAEAERAGEFAAETAPRPAFLSAVNFFGPPEAGLMKRELFPDAELALAGLAALTQGARIVMCVDPLPAFFLAAKSDALEAKVRQTPWEVLYELSWADLLREVVEALPDAEVLVLTGAGAGAGCDAVLARLFGEAAALLSQPHLFLKQQISETGHAVLERMLARGAPDADMQRKLHESFALRPGREEIRERLAIDKVTCALLDDRFAEDLEVIAALPGVEVI